MAPEITVATLTSSNPASVIVAPVSVVRSMFAPIRFTEDKSAPDKSVNVRVEEYKFAPARAAPDKFVPVRFVFARFAPDKSVPERYNPERSQACRSTFGPRTEQSAARYTNVPASRIHPAGNEAGTPVTPPEVTSEKFTFASSAPLTFAPVTTTFANVAEDAAVTPDKSAPEKSTA